VYKPLIALESINDRCRSTLTKLLHTQHKVRIAAAYGDQANGALKGGIWFAAFDPWNTCWRQPAGAFNCFDVAERTGRLSPNDAARLSHALLRKGAHTAANYDGWFSAFFEESRVQFLFRHADDHEHLSDTGLAIGSSFVDYLSERCPWPIIPGIHLAVQDYRDILMGRYQDFAMHSPWLSWVYFLDSVGFGPWLGWLPAEIDYFLDAMGGYSEKAPNLSGLEQRSLGKRITIPIFSNGLQGFVHGVFCGIAKEQQDPIHTTLLQFGQTVADAYAELRLRRFATILSLQLPVENLAKEAVYAFSPIGRIVVETRQGQAGYRLCHENNYWGGYKQLARQELQDRASSYWFTLKCSPGIAIHIEPLCDVPNFDPDFFRIRLESGFRRFISPVDGGAAGDGLSIHEVQRRVRELEAYVDDGRPSYAKMRQYYVALQVERDLQLGETRVTNMKLKSFLEERTGKQARNGYQISSYIGDVERVFPNKLKAEKTRYGVSISWKLAT
jgi:hypothetical protein